MVKDEDGNHYLNELDKRVSLWLHYVPTYREINKNPRAKAALHDDPGYRYMKIGYYLLWIILLLLGTIGYIYSQID